jgi:hypothetical protein
MPPETRSQKRKRLDLEIEKDEAPLKKTRVVKKNTFNKSNKTKNYDRWKLIDSKSNNNDWVSGSSIKNYLLKDSLVDWLELYYYSKKSTKQKINNKESETNILFSKGNEFEQLVFDFLDKKFKNETIMICKSRPDFFNRDLVKETVEAMNSKIPIIKQAMLVNETNFTCGVADLLVRCDYLDKLFKTPVNYQYSEIHYVVIDIKWSLLNLCADGIHILNSDRVPAYKGQVALYNLAMGKLQGYIPSKVFILGKNWRWNSKSLSGYDCFDRCGTIDYETFDQQYIQLTHDAIEWLRDVRLNGSDWDCMNPHRPEMYPNMCSNANPKWGLVKQELADSIEEITKIWMVSSSNRDYAHSNNIFKWSDKKCCSESLNIKGKKIAPVVNKFIEMNRPSESKIITPDSLQMNELSNKDKSVEFYIDFETINDIFMKDSINIHNSHGYSDICFRISVGYELNNTYKFVAFKMKHYSLEEEKRIFCQFRDFIEKFRVKNKTVKIFHWANAEQTFMNHANERHNGFLTQWMKTIELVDVCKIFIKTPIIIKGMFKFKLKEVAKAMYSHGMIQTKWDSDSEISDGLGAMMGAIEYYKDPKNAKNKKMMKKIEHYNDIDTKVVWEIVKYLRKLYC